MRSFVPLRYRCIAQIFSMMLPYETLEIQTDIKTDV